jgi:hypothetical protein
MPAENITPVFAMPEPAIALKEPALLAPSGKSLEIIKRLQHFDSKEWNEVRYSKVLKEYVADPGFKELEINLDLQTKDPSPVFPQMERAFAALSHAILLQREALQNSLREVIEWSTNTEDLSPLSLKIKIQEKFSAQGEYNKISDDMLQICCGKRAEVIEHRRDKILANCVRDFEKEALKKIPPTIENLINEEKLSSQLQKLGGSSKIFRQDTQKPVKSKLFGHSQKVLPKQPFRHRRADLDAKPSTSWHDTKASTSWHDKTTSNKNKKSSGRGQTFRRNK